MKKDFLIDYVSYLIFRLLGPVIRILPVGVSLFLGRRLGDLYYLFDCKHRIIAYANIKRALGTGCSPAKLTRRFYRGFGQSLIEIFLIPLVDKNYIQKYVTVEGRAHIDQALKRGKGVIFLAVHAGSWELSNVISANLGFPLNILIRDQSMPRLNALLNNYRSLKGCKLIQRQDQTKQLIDALKNNETVGITVDQGGKDGVPVEFFGKEASMATGALRLALKYDATLLPAYYTRVKGLHMKLIIEPAVVLSRSGNQQQNLEDNLRKIIPTFERLISSYPQEYMWPYKIWKYSRQRRILVLSDAKAGHLRQAQAVALLAADCLRESGLQPSVKFQEIKFRNSFAKRLLAVETVFSGKYGCQGCLCCLKNALDTETFRALTAENPDIIISCGSSLAPVNLLLSQENRSRSVVLMRPGILSTKRFDLVIMPRHDKFIKRKNIVCTEGALNLINDAYLGEQSARLVGSSGSNLKNKDLYIGFLVGGDSKYYTLNQDLVRGAIRQVKRVAEKIDAQLLITTSRRSSKAIEDIVKEECGGFPRTKLLIVANEKNIPEAIGGILGLSTFVVSSPESISMISEAVNSRAYVLVFKNPGLSKKHQRFLRHFAERKYISLVQANDTAAAMEKLWQEKLQRSHPKDNAVITEAIRRLV